MKKLIAFIKKNDMLVMTLIIAIIVIFEILQGILVSDDSLWDFGNIYKIYTGKVIYKDVNILQTPIFFLIGKLLYTIFSGNYFIFLMYGCIIMTTIYIIIYKLFKILKVRKQTSMLFTISIIILSLEIIKCGINYNTLGLIFVLLGIMYSLKNAEEPKKYNNIIQAIFIITTFLTMQKLGARIYIRLYFI